MYAIIKIYVKKCHTFNALNVDCDEKFFAFLLPKLIEGKTI